MPDHTHNSPSCIAAIATEAHRIRNLAGDVPKKTAKLNRSAERIAQAAGVILDELKALEAEPAPDHDDQPRTPASAAQFGTEAERALWEAADATQTIRHLADLGREIADQLPRIKERPGAVEQISALFHALGISAATALQELDRAEGAFARPT